MYRFMSEQMHTATVMLCITGVVEIVGARMHCDIRQQNRLENQFFTELSLLKTQHC